MKIEIYSRDNCKFCEMAKKLLTDKGLPYTEISVNEVTKPELVKRVVEKTGSEPRTVPQIFINDEYVGGYDNLLIHMK